MTYDVPKQKWLLGSCILSSAIGVGLYGMVSSVNADDLHANYGSPATAVSHYQEQCGDCHFAYPPTLLPQQSWQKIMTNLQDHFGEDADLDAADKQAISHYLQENSLNSLWRFGHRGESEVPERITDLYYFLHEHEDIPNHLIIGNDEVGSMGNCSACHNTDGRKLFDDDNINIPGYGRWDD